MGEAGTIGNGDGGVAARVAELEAQLLVANDAALALAGILANVVVEAGLIERGGLADIVGHRAGPIAAADHNPLLGAFARALRTGSPRPRFDAIAGGRDAAAMG